MPVFAYKGLTEAGRNVQGVIEADGARAARARLRRDGVYPTEVAEEAARSTRNGFQWRSNERIGNADLSVISRQLATLLSAGIPVVEALEAVGEQAERPAITRMLSHLRDEVSQGTSLAEAMEAHPHVFGELYVGMVRAGETAGALHLVLDRLAIHTEAQTRLASQVRNALAYPVIITLVSATIVVLLLAFVVPKVARIFADQEQALPLPTRILLGASSAVTDNGWLLLLSSAGAIGAAVVFVRRPEGRAWFDRQILRLPLIGPILKKVAVARFSRTLATLLGNGIPLLGALELAGRVIGNQALQAAVNEAHTAIREGQSVAEPLRRSGLFPPLLTRMIAVGERSGDLEPMLERVADAYEQEVESSLGGFTAVLEPAMVVVMGGMMVFVVLAILLPIFEINSLVR